MKKIKSKRKRKQLGKLIIEYSSERYPKHKVKKGR